MSPEEFRAAGHELVDAVAGFLESLPGRPVNRDETPAEIRSLLQAGGLPDDGADPRELLRETVPLLAELKAFTHALSITTFRYVPPDLEGVEDVEAYLNDLNDRLLKRLKSSGEVYLSNAVIDGKFLLRACVVNFRTSLEDIEALPEIVIRHGRALHPAS